MTRKKTNATTYDDVLSFDGFLEYPTENVHTYNGHTYAEGEANLLDERGKFITNVELPSPLSLTRLTPADFDDVDNTTDSIRVRLTYLRTWELPRAAADVTPQPIGIPAIALGTVHIDNPYNRRELVDHVENYIAERIAETRTRTVDSWTLEEPGDD